MVRNSVFLLRSSTRQICPIAALLYNITVKVLTNALRQEKEIKGIQIVMEETQFSLFTDDMNIYDENPKNGQKNSLT